MKRLSTVAVALGLLTSNAAFANSLSVTVPKEMMQQVPKNRAESAQVDVAALKTALNRFYIENRTWPGSVAELVTSGYYTGSVVSPYGTNYQLVVAADGSATIAFEAESVRDRSFALSSIRGAEAVANNVNVAIGKPGRDAVQSTFLHRVEVAGRPELNRMEADIDVNGNNVNNVATVDFQTGSFTQLDTDNLTAVDIAVSDRVSLGSNEIVNSGSSLTLNSGTVAVTGSATVGSDLTVGGNATVGGNLDVAADMLLGGNLVMSGGDIVGFNTVSGQSLTLTQLLTAATANIQSVNVDVGVIDQLSGNTLTYNLGEFINLYVSGQLTADSAQINTLNVSGLATLNNLKSNSATINTVTGSSFNYTDAVLGSLTTSGLVASTGNIKNLDAERIEAISVQASAGSFGALSVTGDAAVSGAVTAQNVTVGQNLNTANLTANTATLNSVTGTTGNLTTVNANTANITTVSAQNVTASGTGSFGTLNVSGNATYGGTLTAQNATVSGAANLGSLVANTGSIASLTGSTATFTTGVGRVQATNFSGGSYTGSNFTTSQSSVNTNRTLINQYKAQWDSCVAAGGCQ